MLKPIVLTLVVLATLLLAPLASRVLTAAPVQAEAPSPAIYPFPTPTPDPCTLPYADPDLCPSPIGHMDHAVFLPFVCVGEDCTPAPTYPPPYP
jgi:hypothetical protein